MPITSANFRAAMVAGTGEDDDSHYDMIAVILERPGETEQFHAIEHIRAIVRDDSLMNAGRKNALKALDPRIGAP